MSDELLNVLRGRKEKEKPLPIPNCVPMTRQAREKLAAYATMVKDLGFSQYEWYGFLLGAKEDPDQVVRDVILAQAQVVTGAHVTVDGAQVAQAATEIQGLNQMLEREYHANGWTHSHANFNPYHSPTDNDNHKIVLNSVSLNTERDVPKKYDLLGRTPEVEQLDGIVRLKGQTTGRGTIDFIIENEEAVLKLLDEYGIEPTESAKERAMQILKGLLGASTVKVSSPRTVGFAYSVVVNNMGAEPYAEVAYLVDDLKARTSDFDNKIVPLDVLEDDGELLFTHDEIEDEVLTKIRFPKRARLFVPRGLEYSLERVKSCQKVSKKKLTRLFVDKAIDYALTRSNQYSLFIGDVLATIVTQRKRLSHAMRTTWGEDAEETEFDKSIRGAIAKRAYTDLTGKYQSETVTRFMLDFVNHDSVDAVVDKYAPELVGVDRDVWDFSRQLLDYGTNSKGKYHRWANNVLTNMQDLVNIDDALSLVDESEPMRHFDKKQQYRLQSALCFQEYNEDQRAHIDQFLEGNEDALKRLVDAN